MSTFRGGAGVCPPRAFASFSRVADLKGNRFACKGSGVRVPTSPPLKSCEKPDTVGFSSESTGEGRGRLTSSFFVYLRQKWGELWGEVCVASEWRSDGPQHEGHHLRAATPSRHGSMDLTAPLQQVPSIPSVVVPPWPSQTESGLSSVKRTSTATCRPNRRTGVPRLTGKRRLYDGGISDANVISLSRTRGRRIVTGVLPQPIVCSSS